MEAVRTRQATIDDLLERLLDKGIILNLDLVIGVAGIPLIGINLRAAIASVETMIEYGIMQAWDEQLRTYANAELQRKKLALLPGETILLDQFGSHWYTNGIYRAWRPGRVYLTARRLIVYRAEPAEVLFQTPLAAIRDLLVHRETYFTGAERDLLYLALEPEGEAENVAALYAEDIDALEAALVAHLAALGTTPAGSLIPFLRDREMGAVLRERVVAEGKLWWHAPNDRRSGGSGEEGGGSNRVSGGGSDAGEGGGSGSGRGATWRPGRLYLTVERLLWWSDFDRRVALEIPLAALRSVTLDRAALGGLLGQGDDLRDVLCVRTGGPRGLTARFAGDALPQWRRQIKEQALDCDPDGGSNGGPDFDPDFDDGEDRDA